MRYTAGILSRLFTLLEIERIRYCLWKTRGISDVLSGRSDVDLLIDKSQAGRSEIILLSLGFKRVISQPWQRFPGIEDWLGYNGDTGKLIHIHLHYQIWIGLKYVKQLHLPWEDFILQTAVKHRKEDVYTISPEMEIIFTAIRAVSETLIFTPQKLMGHYRCLRHIIDEEKAVGYLYKLFEKRYADKLKTLILDNDLNAASISKIKAIINRTLGEYRKCGDLAALLIYTSFYARILWRELLKKFLHISFYQKKRFHTGGTLMAIIGCDGAGKTTVTEQLFRWLSWKVDTEKIYLGSGSGLPRRLYTVKRLFMRSKDAKIKLTAEENAQVNAGMSAARMLWKAYIARRIYKSVVCAKRECSKGKVILTDRFPQSSFPGIYDGPSLREQEWRSFPGRLLSQYESKIYQQLSALPPDIVVKLLIPAEIAMQRKPEDAKEDILGKAEITHKLTFPGAHIIEVDAAKPLEEVVISIKNRVWPLL